MISGIITAKVKIRRLSVKKALLRSWVLTAKVKIRRMCIKKISTEMLGIITAKVKIRRMSVTLKGFAEISDTNYNNSKSEALLRSRV